MVQRRTVRRRFYLKPTPTTTKILLYVLAYTLLKYPGVRVHELIAMSNHYHLVLTDTDRTLPKFMQELDSLSGRALNASWGMFGTFWEHEQYSAPEIPNDEDLFEKCVYTVGNACEAGLVEFPYDWEGLTSWHLEYGQPIVVERPDIFFSELMPETLTLTLSRPDILPHLSDRELRAAIRRATIARARGFSKERRRRGLGVVGMQRVLRQSHHADPSRVEKRFGRRPLVSSRSRWTRQQVGERDRSRRRWYRRALAEFRAGDRTVAFPPDTYLMRVRYGCACASP